MDQEIKKEFQQYFKNLKIHQIIGESRPIVSFERHYTFKDVLVKLSQTDVRGGALKLNDQIVFVDYLDIVSFLVDFYSKENFSSKVLKNKKLQEELYNTNIEKLANYSKYDRYETATLDASVYDIIKLLQGNQKVVIMKDGEMVNIVAHSDILGAMKNYIDEHKDLKIWNETIETLNIGIPIENSVQEDEPAMNAFIKMKEKHSSFLPVLDDENKLISVVSIRDINVLGTAADPSILNDTVMDFVGFCRQLSTIERFPYIYCTPDTNFATIVGRLKATRVHRLIKTENKRPIGCVRISDVVEFII